MVKRTLINHSYQCRALHHLPFMCCEFVHACMRPKIANFVLLTQIFRKVMKIKKKLFKQINLDYNIV